MLQNFNTLLVKKNPIFYWMLVKIEKIILLWSRVCTVLVEPGPCIHCDQVENLYLSVSASASAVTNSSV